MATTVATVTVHVHMDLDGEPVKLLVESPTSATLHDQPGGLEITLHLDGQKLADALLPHIIRGISRSVRLPAMRKEYERK